MNHIVNLEHGCESVPNIPSADADDFGRDDLWGDEDMLHFWEASRPWFAERGVYLLETHDKPIDHVHQILWLRPLNFIKQPSLPPYAVCIPPEPTLPPPFRTLREFGFAQDAEHRDLVIRLVQKGSDHHRIFQRLYHDEAFNDPKSFPCVMPPVAILDTPHNYAFVVMPMWGHLTYKRIQNMETLHEALHFIECLLQGLTFLHKHKIVHRDITHVNIMVNCYGYDLLSEGFLDDLSRHRKGGNVYYALMDYDQSKMLPADTDIRTCRRPSGEALYGHNLYKPWDAAHGEPTYNPFAFDVGMLGNLFRVHFINIVPFLPACAALFDQMTTPVVSQRFTAEEALLFLRESTAALDQAALEAPVKLKTREFSDCCWDELTPEQCSEWKRYRAPPRSRTSRILEWLARYRATEILLVYARRVVFRR